MPSLVDGEGGIYELKEGRNVIGASKEQCNIILRDPNITQDAQVTMDLTKSGVIVNDLASASGVYFNGARMGGPQTIVHGDRIAFGLNGKEYKLDMVSSPSVAKSIANSSLRASDVPPMFSVHVSTNSIRPDQSLRKSRVYASYQDQIQTDNALRDLVERQLQRRSQNKAAKAVKNSLSPSHRNYLERQKLRLSQKIRDVNNVMLGRASINDTYLSKKLNHLDESDDEWSGDELPETSEIPQPDEKQPQVVVPTQMQPIASAQPTDNPAQPKEIKADEETEDEEDDELPVTLDHLPDFNEAPMKPKPERTLLQQQRIDAQILKHRMRTYSKAWRMWMDGVSWRRYQRSQIQKQTAAIRIKRFISAKRLAQLIQQRIEARQIMASKRNRLKRVIAIATRQLSRQTFGHWRRQVDSWFRLQWCHRIANKHFQRVMLQQAFKIWNSTWQLCKSQRMWLRVVLSRLIQTTIRSSFQSWRLWCAEKEASLAQNKVMDEQTKQKALVQVMSEQSVAEAAAWSEQAKEMREFLQREAALKLKVEELERRLSEAPQTVEKFDTATQTEVAAPAEQKKSSLLSHTLLKTVVGEVKEKNLKAAIENLENELFVSQERETQLRDEYKQLLESMVRHTAQLEEERKRVKQLEKQIELQASEAEKYEMNQKEFDKAKKSFELREAELRNNIKDLETMTEDMRRREEVKKSMETKTQQETIELMNEMVKKEAQMHLELKQLQEKIQSSENQITQLKYAHSEEINNWKLSQMQLKETLKGADTTIDEYKQKLQELSASMKVEKKIEPQPDSLPHQAILKKNEEEINHLKKNLEALQMKYSRLNEQWTEKQLQEKAYKNNQIKLRAQVSASIESFLEELVSKYDLRILRLGSELEHLMTSVEKDDKKSIQFRAASSLVGYTQEETLAQYKKLCELQESLMRLQQAMASHVQSPQPPFDDDPHVLSQNGKFLHDMLMQRFDRLYQLNSSMAEQAAVTQHGHDTKKLDYGKYLAHTIHTRQVEFVSNAINLLHRTNQLKSSLTNVSSQP